MLHTSLTDPLGHAATFAYDSAGRLHSGTNQLDHTTSYGYDDAGRLASVSAPDDSITSYGYDSVNNLISRTDANLHTTSYGYDSARRLTTLTNPLGKQWSYTYNPDGDRASTIDAVASAAQNPALGTTTYAYDRARQLTTIDYSNTTPDVSFGYDPAGNKTQIIDGTGSKSYAYDDADRITSITRGTDSFTYGYDAADNLTQTTYPDDASVAYNYNDAERLSSLTTGNDTASYDYDAAGNLTGRTLPNDIAESRTYDRAGRLSAISASQDGSQLSDYELTRDADGNPTGLTKHGGTLETYSYDELERLTQVCYQASCPDPSDPRIGWSYDEVGNRLTQTRPEGTTRYSYNAADQLASTDGPGGTTNYTYDGDGRQTSAGTNSYDYDLADHLTQATVGSSTTTYSYDSDGNRITATTGESTTRLLWDENAPLPQLALERTSGGDLLRRYLNDPAGPFSLQTPDGDYTYLQDDRGSIAAVSESSGIDWRYSYEPFGAIRTQTQLDPNAPTNPLAYNGQYLDPHTSLYNLRARQFTPGDGRFLTTDPLAPHATNPYVGAYIYANNQPTTLADPSGLIGCGILRRVCHAIGQRASDTVEATRDLIHGATTLTKQLVIDTAGMLIDTISNTLGCTSRILAGEMRGSGRQCFKAAFNISILLASGAAGQIATKLLAERFGPALLARFRAINWAGERGWIGAAEEGLSWAEQSGILRAAARGKGNFGVGSATSQDADVLGRAWVGEDYTVASDGRTLISKNGLRQYRPPSYKPDLGRYQANLEQRFEGQQTRRWQSNGHLDITNVP